MPHRHAVTVAARADARAPGHCLLAAVALAAAAMLSLPAARGYSVDFGWMPLWLAGLPLAAWLALRRAR